MYRPKLMLIMCLVLLIVVLLIAMSNVPEKENFNGDLSPAISGEVVAVTADKITYADSPLNATYTIDGMAITLENGLSEFESAPDSTSKITTSYFGNEVTLDLNGDGRDDAVFLLTQETGGSGKFYYVVAVLNTETGYIGGEGLLLGDRIAPQTTEISQNPSHKSVVVVNYADRGPGEPMTTKPSVGKSIWLKLDPKTMQFGEVVQNFEGEADMSRLIQVAEPLANQKVTSPLKVRGKAVGNWYFEASFPIEILDANGKKLGVTTAQAKSDWMTTDFVPFETMLSFEKPITKTGILILKKDNPSGLEEKDASISMPVTF